ncbi:hypothetical protein NFHSH190041_04340 [Shewanella sp. NFH-SH190041]|uniref:hypothetical protein n=1 Tax=Shewanella sp. NFH-SH190041 TaxID=2950245 RepID=UPI0021C3FBE6|nr:hypothetical protein [Shewanella sp. NFH-SH190041]BDM62982.1 hypothetical protein NFHSH190041_04340 [Shewanella sp. NFH-SH190041]
MNFNSFPYSLDIKGKCFQGELDTLTGIYAGGSVESITTTSTRNNHTTSSTSYHTTINVRMANGKVKSVVKSGKVNVPSQSAITLFYYTNDGYLYPYAVYIHDTDELHTLGKVENKKVCTIVSGWSSLRRLWGSIIDFLHIASVIAIASLAAFFVNEVLKWDTFAMCLTFLAALCIAIFCLNAPARWLGGSFSVYDDLEVEIKRITLARAKEIDNAIRNSYNPTDNLLDIQPYPEIEYTPTR